MYMRISIGWLSDRFGRRPILLTGLLGNAVGMVLFGAAQSYPGALYVDQHARDDSALTCDVHPMIGYGAL